MKPNVETNNVNEHNMVKNPNLQEEDQLAIYEWPRSWTNSSLVITRPDHFFSFITRHISNTNHIPLQLL